MCCLCIDETFSIEKIEEGRVTINSYSWQHLDCLHVCCLHGPFVTGNTVLNEISFQTHLSVESAPQILHG